MKLRFSGERRLLFGAMGETQTAAHLRMHSMINPNGEEFTQNDPLAGSAGSTGAASSAGSAIPMGSTASGQQQQQQSTSGAATTPSRFQDATGKVSTAASGAWRQTRESAGTARQRTDFLLRENPVPTVIGALALGLAIGLAIRYSSESADRHVVETKTPLGNVDLSMLTMPFLWPFFKTVRRRAEDSAEVVRDGVRGGVERLRDVDVNQYVKPLRKKWRSWTN